MNRRYCVFVFLVISVWVQACTFDKSSVEEDIKESMFRYSFANNGSNGRFDYYFIRIQESDPPIEFLNRFRNEVPKVFPVSKAKYDLGTGVSHVTLGGEGIIFTITSLEWIDDSKVKVSWEYYRNGLSASGNIATIELKDNKWTVTSDRGIWISVSDPNKTLHNERRKKRSVV